MSRSCRGQGQRLTCHCPVQQTEGKKYLFYGMVRFLSIFSIEIVLYKECCFEQKTKTLTN